jgi:hypothetical protein
MSNTIIEDGTGKGFLCKVDNTNKLEVHSVGLAERGEAIQLGRGFEIGAFPIDFTGTTETAMIYVKNNEASPLVIDAWEFSGAESTGGTSDVCLLKLYQGPTGLTNSTPGGAVNGLFGSSRELSADIETGNGSTSAVTGGTLFGASYMPYLGRAFPFSGPWVLQRGKSIALTVTPPASNTSMLFGVRILCHLQRDD